MPPLGSELLPAHADRLHGLGIDDPGGDVQGVDGLFDDEIARDLLHVVPAAQLALEALRRHFTATARPRVVGLAQDDGAEIPLAYAAQRLAVERVGPRLKIHQEYQLLPRGPLAGIPDALAAGGVDGDGLATNTCLPASTAAAQCSGWKLGGDWTITASSGASSSRW
ncbi:MAG: hypothetical protein M5U12_29025 [Verrucomicrobia bacterium]|nr:hypothetical protein [Verrucomicrobiota bacterium]